jgi:Bardet-Biedl syndrome 4 protein
LKRALFLDPFEWIVAYNLGLVHLHTGQYASAFHFFSASINLKPDFASSYMYLGIALNRLEDYENACSAFEKAVEMEQWGGGGGGGADACRDFIFHLNFAIMCANHHDFEKAKRHFDEFQNLFSSLDEDSKNADADVIAQRDLLQQVLRAGA